MILFGPNTWLPDLSETTQACIRTTYGLLLLGTLLRSLPYGRRFFLSERWGGYAQSSPPVDAVQNPLVYPILMAGWLTVSVLLTLGIQTVAAAFVNLALCYYFFIWMRWRGVLRGMGAPGFMTCWLAVAVLLLEWTLQHAPAVRGLALLTLQVDFALIMFSAGFYKLTAGYARNDGMELGMVNPQWGYWPGLWRKLPPRHFLFRTMNHLAWSTEFVAGVLMLIPATRFLGSLLIIFSFVFIATQIRLCLLTEMVIVGGLLYFAPGTLGQRLVDALSWPAASGPDGVPSSATWVTWLLGLGLGAYLLALPLAHAGLFYNFYRNKRLPRSIQVFLERFTNLFGIIIWRVFSADHTNFYVRVYRQPAAGPREQLSRFEGLGGRFTHVGENIALTSVFTSLKYYPSNNAIFRERLLRYARTLPCPVGANLVFEYISLRKTDKLFYESAIAEFLVDPIAGSVLERPLAQNTDCLRAANPGSPVHEGTRPGSYAA